MTTQRVLGESADELRAAMNGPADPTGALARALMRAEAELLVADALAMKVGTYEDRTPDQRLADARLLIFHRLEEVTRAA
jgi:hypothetical protein